jgi:hypothetical protein
MICIPETVSGALSICSIPIRGSLHRYAGSKRDYSQNMISKQFGAKSRRVYDEHMLT